ncbi:hypothetical protein E2C01_040857 [Portunus trituberculatus]|uniref:Uncharacterized protein n=1 Tax=Portunus trituberculatus TaxID=210409 RepID=A0A5B7FPW8_PORTR|nr:hypothetical protein [Portunus trituberculatus]
MARKIACPAILESLRAVWEASVPKFCIRCEHSYWKYTEAISSHAASRFVRRVNHQSIDHIRVFITQEGGVRQREAATPAIRRQGPSLLTITHTVKQDVFDR